MYSGLGPSFTGLRNAAAITLGAVSLLCGAASAQAASSITSVAYDAEATAETHAELPAAVALRLTGVLDPAALTQDSAAGVMLRAPGAACPADAAAALDDPIDDLAETPLEAGGPFSETVIADEVAGGSYLLCAYVFNDGDTTTTLATASWMVTLGDPTQVDPADPDAFTLGGSAGPGSADDSDGGAAGKAPACRFSKPPTKPASAIVLSCTAVTGNITVVAGAGKKARTVRVTLRGGRASIKAKRLGLNRKRATSVQVKQQQTVLLRTKLKLRKA